MELTLRRIRNMTIQEFAYWYQRANGHTAERDTYWAAKQQEIIRFLEQLEKLDGKS